MDSIDELLAHSQEQLREIEGIYQRSLAEKDPGQNLRARIKGFLENERSSLDYLAVRITAAYGSKNASNVYYPLAPAPTEFDRLIDKNMPGVRLSKPEIGEALKQYQPYTRSWLGKLNRLTRENKHNDLSAQTRTSRARREVRGSGGVVSWDPRSVRFGGSRIEFGPGGGISFGPGGGIEFGQSGVYIMGEQVDPVTQRTPSTIDVIYVDWLFSDLNVSVLGTLREFATEVPKAINEIRQIARV